MSNTKIIFLFSLLLFFAKQELIPLKFDGETKTISNEDKNDIVTYKISVSNTPNYLKITAKGKGSGDQSKTNHIISYHKEEKNINEREQLSQSDTEITIMYLNKEQLLSEFFISIQCKIIPCSYDFILESNEYAELNLTDSFSYYVTESNKKMKFKISGIPYTPFANETIENQTITIYAIGNLEINSTLESDFNFTKHRTYNAYLIQIYDLNKTYEFNLIIEGTAGDLIQIGSNFHDGSKYSSSHKLVSKHGRFTFGYLKRGIKTKNCFKVEEYRDKPFLQIVNLENREMTISSDSSSHSGIYFYCAEINSKTYYDEMFYILKILNETDQNYFDSLRPQILGSGIIYYLDPGLTYAFYSPLVDNNFLNYELFRSELEISYYECETFPICEINETTTKNAKKIKSFNLFNNLVLDNKKLKNITPISQKQYLILLTCKNEADIDRCYTYSYAYSNNNKVLLGQENVYKKYLLKNSQNLIQLSTDYLNRYSRLDVLLMVYSGNIKIDIIYDNNKYEVEKYEDNKQHIFTITKKDKYEEGTIQALLKIKAEENSYFSIKSKNIDEDSYWDTLYTGSNYAFNLDKQTELELGVKIIERYVSTLYVGFKTYNCIYNISRVVYKGGYIYETLDIKDNYTQDIIPYITDFHYLINKLENSTDNSSCLLNVYTYSLKNKTEYDSNVAGEIFLTDNVPQRFIFNETINFVKFLYPNVEIENDLSIEVKNPNNVNFEITIFFNDEKFDNNIYKIISDTTFTIQKDKWKSLCNENIIVCGVSFGVYFESNGNGTFEITVNSINNTDSNDDNNNNNSNNFALKLLIGVSIVLLVIVVLLIWFIKRKSKREQISNIMDSNSFQDEQLMNTN